MSLARTPLLRSALLALAFFVFAAVLVLLQPHFQAAPGSGADIAAQLIEGGSYGCRFPRVNQQRVMSVDSFEAFLFAGDNVRNQFVKFPKPQAQRPPPTELNDERIREAAIADVLRLLVGLERPDALFAPGDAAAGQPLPLRRALLAVFARLAPPDVQDTLRAVVAALRARWHCSVTGEVHVPERLVFTTIGTTDQSPHLVPMMRVWHDSLRATLAQRSCARHGRRAAPACQRDVDVAVFVDSSATRAQLLAEAGLAAEALVDDPPHARGPNLYKWFVALAALVVFDAPILFSDVDIVFPSVDAWDTVIEPRTDAGAPASHVRILSDLMPEHARDAAALKQRLLAHADQPVGPSDLRLGSFYPRPQLALSTALFLVERAPLTSAFLTLTLGLVWVDGGWEQEIANEALLRLLVEHDAFRVTRFPTLLADGERARHVGVANLPLLCQLASISAPEEHPFFALMQFVAPGFGGESLADCATPAAFCQRELVRTAHALHMGFVRYFDKRQCYELLGLVEPAGI